MYNLWEAAEKVVLKKKIGERTSLHWKLTEKKRTGESHFKRTPEGPGQKQNARAEGPFFHKVCTQKDDMTNTPPSCRRQEKRQQLIEGTTIKVTNQRVQKTKRTS